MSKQIKDRINDNLDRAKGEGKLRSENIRGLLSDAASLTVSELKEGTDQMRSILKDAISAVIAELANLDSKLAARYGDRYVEVKQQLDGIKVLYDRAKGEADFTRLGSRQYSCCLGDIET